MKDPRECADVGDYTRSLVATAATTISLYPVARREEMKRQAREALAAYIAGTPTTRQENLLREVYNRNLVLCGLPGIVKGDADAFHHAVLATIKAVANRCQAKEDRTLTPAEADDMTAMVEMYEQMLDNVPFRDHEKARKILVARKASGQGVYDPETGTRYDNRTKKNGKRTNKKR